MARTMPIPVHRYEMCDRYVPIQSANATPRTAWTDPGRDVSEAGYFVEIITPPAERFETVFSSPEVPEGVACMAPGMSAAIEEHFYWGSMRDRLPMSQGDPLYPSGSPVLEDQRRLRTVRLGDNTCLIHSGQDITDTGEHERGMYLEDLQSSLSAGMEFLTRDGSSIGCYVNRYVTMIDENGPTTDRTFGTSWWRDLSALEEWAASHPTHLKIYGDAMRHLSTLGPETKLRLYRVGTVPAESEQVFCYLDCHDQTGLLRAVL